MIELGPDVWVHGIWFVGWDGCDWMACIRKANGKWRLDYRFRYHKDDKAFDSKDEKSWYSAEPKDGNGEKGLEDLIAGVHEVSKAIADSQNTEVDFLLLDCKGDDPKIIFELGDRPWGNPKMMPRH
jgi:hypothetical protein